MKIELFIKKDRHNLLERLKKAGKKVAPKDSLFLTINGTPVQEGSLEKEFQNIVRAAGLQDERACMSMYRHRFITNMVKVHLVAFMDQHPGKARGLMTESDYRTILKRVATFTGHGSEESLIPYIDLAWEELGTFDYTQPAINLLGEVEGGINAMDSLMAEIRLNPGLSRAQVVEYVNRKLQSIKDATSAALVEHTKKSRNRSGNQN